MSCCGGVYSVGLWEAELVAGKAMGRVVQCHCLLDATAERLHMSGALPALGHAESGDII